MTIRIVIFFLFHILSKYDFQKNRNYNFHEKLRKLSFVLLKKIELWKKFAKSLELVNLNY